MSRTPGRNDPCWCGSGRKYKRCHLDRDEQPKVDRWEAAKRSRQAFSRKTCMAPSAWLQDCSGGVVRAHTVPRSGSLNQIAEDGHVLALSGDLSDLVRTGGRLLPKLVGVRQASTFHGFCSRHDSEIFAPLEDSIFLATPEQCFLLAYRAFSLEVYKKLAALEVSEIMRLADRGRPLADQLFVQDVASSYEAGTRAALRDATLKEPEFERALVSADYTSVRAYVLTFDIAPPVMASGGFAPERDFDGRSLQDMTDLNSVADLMTVSSFFGGQWGHIVLAWLIQDDSACRRLVESLDSRADEDIASALVALLFEYCENLYMSPTWWDQFSAAEQGRLELQMRASADPTCERAGGVLTDYPARIPSWGLRSRQWVS